MLGSDDPSASKLPGHGELTRGGLVADDGRARNEGDAGRQNPDGAHAEISSKLWQLTMLGTGTCARPILVHQTLQSLASEAVPLGKGIP
jgi:hypothetical protein